MLWKKIKNHPFFKDRLFLIINSVNGVLLITFIVNALIRISQRDFAIATRYSFKDGFVDFWPWYSAHIFTAFVVLVFVLNFVVAQVSLRKSKVSSFLILIGTGLILMLSIVVFNVYANNVGF